MKPLQPLYIKLKSGNRYRDTISHGSLVLDYNTVEDESLTNQFYPVGEVESVPESPDLTGKLIGLLPGDTIWGSRSMFGMEWHDKRHIHNHQLKDFVHVNQILAFERDGKLYGCPQADVSADGIVLYQKSQNIIGLHRPDIASLVKGRRSTIISLDEDLGIGIDTMSYSAFEVISEGPYKGKILFVDMPAPFEVDVAQAQKKGIATCLTNGTYYAFEEKYVVAEIVVENQ